MKKIKKKADEQIFDIFPLITASVMNALCGKRKTEVFENIWLFFDFQKLQWASSCKPKISNT